VWYGKNDIIYKLSKTYPIEVCGRNINPLASFTTILEVGSFITRELSIRCPIKQKALIGIKNFQRIGIDQIIFYRCSLDQKSFDIATELYFDYIFDKFSDNLGIFTLCKLSERKFMLS